ncbi:hypothetical protein AB9Q04_03925 [Anaerococcus sp. ENR1011]|uniref:Uncharacterized protein n=1 Tax=Anaerococcus groningensis TaxID=3115616 RepID=A0ABW9N0A9_9FIRM
MNDKFQDFLEVTSKAFKESFSKFNKIYVAFFVFLVRAAFLNSRMTSIIGGGFLGGLINYFIEVALLCFVAQSMRSVVVYGNTGKKSIGNSINNFWQPILSTFFYFYLIEMIINLLPGYPDIKLFLYVAFHFLMSALLEEVYINGNAGTDALKKSAKFVCDNILTYGIFCLICLIIIAKLTLNSSVGFTSRAMYILLIAIIDLIFYLVRGHLFKYLDKHSYRQRKFMRG